MQVIEEIDRTKLRYVLYARKSTEDEGSQVRTHKDQIKHCMKLAEAKGLNVVDTFKESKSAKKSNNRPIFNQILEDIRNNKYDAILAFAPDRLSRNMLEGGLLINMLDEGMIKDLQFPTLLFSNDASGKLTLGIMFSISKHFSDDLSRKVQSGVSGNLEDGKSGGQPKWGYDRDDQDGLYRPNDWFDVIQESWYMRARGATNNVKLPFFRTPVLCA